MTSLLVVCFHADRTVERLVIQIDDSAPACVVSVNQTAAGSYQLSVTQAEYPVGCKSGARDSCGPILLEIASGAVEVSTSFFVISGNATIAAGDSVSLGLFAPDPYQNPARLSNIEVLFTRSDATPVAADVIQVSDETAFLLGVMGLCGKLNVQNGGTKRERVS